MVLRETVKYIMHKTALRYRLQDYVLSWHAPTAVRHLVCKEATVAHLEVKARINAVAQGRKLKSVTAHNLRRGSGCRAQWWRTDWRPHSRTWSWRLGISCAICQYGTREIFAQNQDSQGFNSSSNQKIWDYLWYSSIKYNGHQALQEIVIKGSNLKFKYTNF